MVRALLKTFFYRSTLFDRNYYLYCYKDVASSGQDPEQHYFNHGWKEGRNPSKSFHTIYYTCLNLSGYLSCNPFEHYISAGGEASGLSTFPESAAAWLDIQRDLISGRFDQAFYVNNYSAELRGMAPLDHYMQFGWKMGFNPCQGFNSLEYLSQNSHIYTSNINPFAHYLIMVGLNRNSQLIKPKLNDDLNFRNAIIETISPYFDAIYYLEKNNDVAKAGLDPIRHFVDYGWNEGRNPCGWFHTAYYTSKYPLPPRTNPFFYFITEGKAKGQKPNPIGMKEWGRPAAPDDVAWEAVNPAKHHLNTEVCVIVPVYKGYADTLATIHSVLSNPQASEFCLLVINDASPEGLLSEKLRDLASKNLFEYLENETNLGFINSVNRGIDAFNEIDIILLNSDTLVYGNWLDRMLAHVRKNPKIATVTPLSNNASICSYPNANDDNKLALEIPLSSVDQYASVCNSGRHIEIPTGVGFCFFIRRKVIKEIGSLDPGFGKGYGEENDFCMRVIKAGYLNVLAQDVFVYHSGSVSFAEIKAREYEHGQLRIVNKHPDYLWRVRDFINSKISVEGRIRIDLYRIAKKLTSRSAVLFTFTGSGGVETHVQNMSSRLESNGMSVLIFRLHKDDFYIEIFDKEKEIYVPSIGHMHVARNISLIREFMDWLRPEIIHIQSLAMSSWNAAAAIMGYLMVSRHKQYFVTLHDFNPVCHRHNLVDLTSNYCKTIQLDKCDMCLKADPNVSANVDPRERALLWAAFLASARKVFCPSNDTSTLMRGFFDGLAIVVKPHEEALGELKKFNPPSRQYPRHVAIIGAIGPHKGSNIIASIALDARNRSLPIKYSIIGFSDQFRELEEMGVTQTGVYNSIKDCVDLLKEIEPCFAFFPSIWPETYCYTLSIALALGIPPFVFDIGAPAERVRTAGFGGVLNYDLINNPGAINDILISLSIDKEWENVKHVSFDKYDKFLNDYYDL